MRRNQQSRSTHWPRPALRCFTLCLPFHMAFFFSPPSPVHKQKQRNDNMNVAPSQERAVSCGTKLRNRSLSSSGTHCTPVLIDHCAIGSRMSVCASYVTAQRAAAPRVMWHRSTVSSTRHHPCHSISAQCLRTHSCFLLSLPPSLSAISSHATHAV